MNKFEVFNQRIDVICLGAWTSAGEGKQKGNVQVSLTIVARHGHQTDRTVHCKSRVLVVNLKVTLDVEFVHVALGAEVLGMALGALGVTAIHTTVSIAT